MPKPVMMPHAQKSSKPPAKPNGIDLLTDFERMKLENLALKHNALQQQIQAILAERNAYLKAIEAAHPGYRWQEGEGLVPADQPS